MMIDLYLNDKLLMIRKLMIIHMLLEKVIKDSFILLIDNLQIQIL